MPLSKGRIHPNDPAMPYDDMVSSEISEIVRIERRELIAQFPISERGTLNPLRYAMEVVTDWMIENLSERGVNIEFSLYDQRFTVSASERDGK